MNQEAGPRQAPKMPALWSWTSQPPNISHSFIGWECLRLAIESILLQWPKHTKTDSDLFGLSATLPHTLVPILGHFQAILFHKVLSRFLQPRTHLSHSENNFPQPVSTSSYYCSPLIPFTTSYLVVYIVWIHFLKYLLPTSPFTIWILLLALFWKLLSLRSLVRCSRRLWLLTVSKAVR